MPRYHFRCKSAKCEKETVYLSHDGHEIDSNFIDCAFCGFEVKLEGYFMEDDRRIVELQDKIEKLCERIEYLDDYFEVPDLTLVKDQLN